MMLQACLGQIAVQAYATFLGKCFEIVIVLLKGDADKLGKDMKKAARGGTAYNLIKVKTKKRLGKITSESMTGV